MDIPTFIRWSQYLCYIKYSVNILAIFEFDSHDPCAEGLLKEQDVDRDYFYYYLGVIIGFLVFSFVGTVLVMVWKTRGRSKKYDSVERKASSCCCLLKHDNAPIK